MVEDKKSIGPKPPASLTKRSSYQAAGPVSARRDEVD